MSNPYPSPNLLSGKVLLEVSMVQGWLNLVNKLIPFTSGELLILLTENQSQLSTLLALPIDPTVAVGTIVTPIVYVYDLKNSLAVYDHQFSGYQGDPNMYRDVTYEVDSVFIQFSSFYFNGGFGKLFIY